MKQIYKNYTNEDFKVWKILFERQIENLKDKASKDYNQAIYEMKDVINADEVPDFEKINLWFKQSTGWEIECVPGLIPVDEFFILLANKKFPSSTWLRSMDKLDYLEEPDMFHDIFGHVPLLCNDEYSKFVHEFGKLGTKYIEDEQKLKMLQRLYWFTIEFGLIKQNSQLRIYGAGILSSFGESISSLKSNLERIDFDIDTIMNTDFCTSEMQGKYFILNNISELNLALTEVTQNWNQYEVESI